MTTKLARHQLAPDANVPPDTKGRRFCTCGAREDHERHDVRPMTAEQRALDERRLGESENR